MGSLGSRDTFDGVIRRVERLEKCLNRKSSFYVGRGGRGEIPATKRSGSS